MNKPYGVQEEPNNKMLDFNRFMMDMRRQQNEVRVVSPSILDQNKFDTIQKKAVDSQSGHLPLSMELFREVPSIKNYGWSPENDGMWGLNSGAAKAVPEMLIPFGQANSYNQCMVSLVGEKHQDTCKKAIGQN
jgi:hypothetical protein